MALTFHRFQQLRPRAQLLCVMTAGTYLTHRWHGASIVKLYFLPNTGRGFFAETGLDEAQDCYTVLRSFSHSAPLADYARYVPLLE
jgi:hypothetical protein